MIRILVDGQWKAKGRPNVAPGSGSGAPASGLMGWELTTANTGLAKHGLVGANLPLYTGSATPAAGTTITGQRITTTLDLSAGNITIDKCLIKPASVGAGSSIISTSDGNLNPPAILPTIRDCDIETSGLTDQMAGRATAFWGIANLYGNKIWGMGSGIAILQSGNSQSAVVRGNYVYALRSVGDPATTGNHCDAFTVRDFSNAGNSSRSLIVDENRFDCTTNNATGACFLQCFGAVIANVTISDNLLEGAGYNLVLEQHTGSYTNIGATNNRFAPTGYGPGYVSGGPGFAVFSENYRNNPANPDNKGVLVSAL